MGFAFVQPSYLLLLLLLIPIWAITFAGRRLQGSLPGSAGRTWAALLLRSTILLALVLALAGAQIVRSAPNVATVFVLDTSDSISPAARARGEQYIVEALQQMPSGDRAGIVTFGADAIVERPVSGDKTFSRLTQAPDSTQTDIARALRLALATLPADAQKRVVLLSDGGETRQTEGVSALDLAAQAQGESVPIETVLLSGPPAAEDVIVERLEAPAGAREGQAVRLVVQANVRRGSTTEARLRILRDRQVVLETAVKLRAGANRIPVTVEAPRGFHTWEAHLDAAGDTVGANNVAFGFTEVRGPPRILLVQGAPGRATALQAALQQARIEAQVSGPADLPQSLRELDLWDAVVLADVSYRQLPPAAAKLLPTYVRELGHGLLMIGGEDSYAAGGYENTPVEAALPVTMRLRGLQPRPDVALVMVIDRSGSMSGEKLNLAKEGIAQAFTALEEGDQVGVIGFDTAASWVVDLQRKPAAESFLGAVSGIAEGGGTDLRPGLEQATDALARAQAKVKHIVLLTDGQAEHNYDDVVQQLKRDGITLSTVGVGNDYDSHLKDIASTAAGRFYEVKDYGEIPRLFFDETVRIARRGIVEETFTPRLGALLGPASAAVRQAGAVPPLHGYNAVTPRDTAQVALTSPSGDPILAEWQYGLGRAVAWTSDMKGQWARDWVRWNEFGRFGAQLADALIARPTAQGYDASASVSGTSLAVELRAQGGAGSANLRPRARLVGADGSALEVNLVEREPGRFRATTPLPAPGVYRLQVVAPGQGGATQILATSGAIVPPSSEYLQPEGNPGLLEAIARATGGHANFPAGDAFRRPSKLIFRSAAITWPLLWLAVLLWPLDIATRRLLVPAAALRRAMPTRIRSSRPAAPARGDLATARVAARARARRSEEASAARAGTIPPAPASTQQQGQTPGEPGVRSAAPRSWRETRRALPERPARREDGPR